MSAFSPLFELLSDGQHKDSSSFTLSLPSYHKGFLRTGSSVVYEILSVGREDIQKDACFQAYAAVFNSVCL